MVDVNTQVPAGYRAVGAALGAVALLTFLGFAPAWALCRAALTPYRLLLAPLLGWFVLTFGGYLLLTHWTFGVALAAMLLASAVADVAVAGWWNHRAPYDHDKRLAECQGSRRPWIVPLVLTAVSCGVFLLALSPHLYHGTLALLVHNQDDEFFVDTATHFWREAAGWRLEPRAYRIDTGWAYHLALALFRMFPWLDDYEAVAVAGYLPLALAVPPTFVFFHRELRLPWRLALAGAGLAQVHGLVLWAPGYGFGPNAVAIAAAPLTFLAMSRALRLCDRRSLVLAGVAMALLLMAYTKVTIVLVLLTGIGVAISISLGAFGGRRRPLVRLVTVGVIGSVLAAYSLYDIGAWTFVEISQSGRLLFNPEESSGAGWGWRDFPSPGAWFGADTWSLIALPWPVQFQPVARVLTALGALAGGALVAAAVAGLRRQQYRPMLGLLIGCALFWFYARYLKAFPYAVFKLYTLTGFFAVGLCLRGAVDLLRFVSRGARLFPVHLHPKAARLSVLLVLGAYLLAFSATSAQTLRFYLQPWGPALSTQALAEVHEIARAVAGGGTVLLSGAFPVPADPGEAAVRPHPIAFHSRWQAEQSGAARVRAALLNQLDRAGARVTGIFEHPGGYVIGVPDEYQFVVLGAGEDPRFYGVDESMRVKRGRLLALFRGPPYPALTAPEQVKLLAHGEGDGNVRLRIACDGTVSAASGDAPEELGQAVACGRGRLRLGLLPVRPGPVAVHVTSPRETRSHTLYLNTGFVWHDTPPIELPAAVVVAPVPPTSTSGAAAGQRPGIYVGGAALLPTDAWTESIDRPDGGVAILGLQAHDGTLVVDVRYGGVVPPQDLRVALVTTAVGPGKGFPTDVDTGKPYQAWQWRLRPGQVIEQRIDGSVVTMPGTPAWPAEDGRHWVRLQFRRGEHVWLDVPVGYGEAKEGRFVSVRQTTTIAHVPLPEPATTSQLPPAGTLVKGNDEHVFVIEGNALHWIRSLDAFVRRGYSWHSVTQMSDDVLSKWPVGLPID